jgi:hypothetical protein
MAPAGFSLDGGPLQVTWRRNSTELLIEAECVDRSFAAEPKYESRGRHAQVGSGHRTRNRRYEAATM